jgi:hydrogenase maturation protein HypF
MSVSAENSTTALTRLRINVRGVVQGVGFRPHVYGCALRCGVTGFVGNESGGVFIEAEGGAEALECFERELTACAPPLAHIEEISAKQIAVRGDERFVIAGSEPEPGAHTLISPDICICDDCLRELFDPKDRRYRYPFINCTNCGPRFTITRGVPYDRPLTTMAGFVMCAECRREYGDPLSRRFHAQPNACAACGPEVEFKRPHASSSLPGEIAIAAAQQALRSGETVAVKGVGGFHLACDAANEDAVRKLRECKGRVDKPFAVMTRGLETAERFAVVGAAARALLQSRERPIVLLKKKSGGGLSELLAPGNDYIGVMLPYSPLHHVLLAAPAPDVLVMTSGNYSNEPIVTDNSEALERLSPLADAFLLHDRDIHVPCDDSVIRVFENHELPIRRSRGYAPFPVKLPFALRPTLAVGGELKATFCLVKGDHALMSQHVGDMENLETLQAMEQSIKHFRALFRTEPEIIAGDKHPRYLSSQWAKANLHLLSGEPARWRAVQHHHAHVAAVMAENGLGGDRPVIGFAFDGTGYGDDGAVWGGEVMIADYGGFRRAAHLRYVPLPGGDAAVERPYRIALAHLWASGAEWDEKLPPVIACPQAERKVLLQQLQKSVNTIPTSSAGRLFDAVAALTGVQQRVTYEAQAAIEFEALADQNETGSYEFALSSDEPVQIDAAPVIRAVAADVLAGVAAPVISARFHNAVARMILQLAAALREKEKLNQVALSGGVFQNVTLLAKATSELRRAGFAVLTHRQVPPNDGGLALGQAVVANFMGRR